MKAIAETRRERFVRLANSRVTRLLKDLQLVGNLANRSNYDYTVDDVERMFRAIAEATKEARARFDAESKTKERRFRLE